MYYVQTPSGIVFQTVDPKHWPEATVLPAERGAALYRAQSIESLRAKIEPGSRVYTLLRSVSRSGMRRTLSALIVRDGRIENVTHSVAVACGYRTDKHGHIVVGGCGFDAGYDIVHSLGRALWLDGTPEPHGARNGQPDSDGGYALDHSWL